MKYIRLKFCWSIFMFCVAYGVGNLQIMINHLHLHDELQDPCYNAHLCASAAPIELCVNETRK